MVINRNLTNEEILANDSIREKVNSGQIVVIDKVQTNNPDYVNLYFIGLVDGLATGTTQVSDLAAQLLGWDNSGIPLSYSECSKDIADKIPIGHGINGCIRVLILQNHSLKAKNHDKIGKVVYYITMVSLFTESVLSAAMKSLRLKVTNCCRLRKWLLREIPLNQQNQ